MANIYRRAFLEQEHTYIDDQNILQISLMSSATSILGFSM